MKEPLSAAEKQRRAQVRDRELRRFIVTLIVGGIVFVVLNAAIPPLGRGQAYVLLLGLGLLLALVGGRAVDRMIERRRVEREARRRGRGR